ncbi:serine hydrolase domain-containing protein [Alienimonas chondri]|uniref:Beta-lactamase-related domain-containing protein n=1 Tax=Alienimonas chondri TaxID=2681879 RepID=A0ABX1VDB4_9PLAN|nr:serine hydrolase domain-containing protein [Alienimonas chondri]NNJ25905.1 hypothetical protein [Alienimonas chondri]
MQWTDDPAEIGLDATRWARVRPLVNALCGDAAASICVGSGGMGLRPLASGSIRPNGPPATPETRFAVASLTKPLVATLALAAVERGELSLGDRVCDHLPAFVGGQKRRVRVLHLLSHTSGLPDLLADDRELRLSETPLDGFLERAIQAPLAFEPGRACRYSSLGFAVLWSVLTGDDPARAGRLLSERVFEPLQMTAASLGAAEPGGDATVGAVAEVRNPALRLVLLEDRIPIWNSAYWRALGAPWGGAISTAADLGRFCAAWATGGGPILSSAAVRTGTTNALRSMRHVPEEDRRCRPWGLGWRGIWPAHAAYFGDLLPAAAYGHWGATGCVMWVNPTEGTWAVILTALPQEPDGGICGRLSNAIVASFVAD